MQHKNKLVLALDLESLDEAKSLVKELKDHVGVFKVGMSMFTRYGLELVNYIHENNAKVFLDLKFHDIPNTVASAIKSAVELGVFMCNVHTLGGKDMMKAASVAAAEASAKKGTKPPILLGVTVLTSTSEKVLNEELFIKENLGNFVKYLAQTAKDCGLSGVVASPQEIEIIRKSCGKDFVIVTPGVRPAWSSKDDQERITTPRDAIKLGADYIVIGRPILKAKDRVKAAMDVLEEIV